MIEDDYLTSIGLLATTCGLLCCRECQVSYSPSGMHGHLKSSQAHIGIRRQVPAAEYWTAVGRCDISEELPAPPFGLDIPPIPGLSVHYGWYCNYCPAAASTRGSLKKHYQTKHRGVSITGRAFDRGYMQQFNPSTSKQWFRVQPTETHVVSGDDDNFRSANYALLTRTSMDPSIAKNIHNVSAWLKACNWYEHTKGIDIEEARGWVAPPSDPELAPLQQAVVAYVRENERNIDHVHVLLRQILHSSDPDGLCVYSSKAERCIMDGY